MKKICFFNSNPVWGGGEKFYLDFALGMQALGYEIIGFCYPRSPLSLKYEEANIFVHELKVKNRSALNPFKVIRLAKLLKQESPDIIIFTSSADLKLGALAAKIAKIPTVIYRRGLAVPIKNRWTNRLIFKHLVTHILANSEETKKTILQNLSDIISPEDVIVIYNGLEVNKKSVVPFDPGIDIPANHIILGNAGRLVPQKGQLMLVEIAAILKASGLPFTMLIAGSGELEDTLINTIKAKNLDEEVYLVGYVDNIAGFMQYIDLFLLTSLWEGFGYVISEAALQQKPTVAFNISSNPEIIDSEKTGILVPVNDVKAFAAAVLSLAQQPEMRQKMGEASYNKIVNVFEIRAQIKKFEQFITS